MDGRVEDLVEAITALPDMDDCAALEALLAAHDLLTARVCATIERVDTLGAAVTDGAVNTAQWLRTRGRRSHRETAHLLKVSARLRTCPAVSAAWRDGRLSTAQVDAVVANVTERTAALFTDHESTVVPALVGLSPRHTATAMQHWAAHATALIDGPPPPAMARSLYLSGGIDGGGELTGRLDPGGFELVDTALAAATTDDTDGEPARTAAERRADALVAVARFFLDHADSATTRRRRPHVHVVVTVDELERRAAGRTLDGRLVDDATLAALLCDAGVHRLVTDGASVTLDAGRTTRTVNHHLFTALAVRDQGCRFPGCDRPVSWCDAHHATAWHHGGRTDQDNLVLLCWRHHHHFAHHPHWHLKLLPDATVEVTTPDGRTLTSHPRPAPNERPPPWWR
jgi:hypothetical protein